MIQNRDLLSCYKEENNPRRRMPRIRKVLSINQRLRTWNAFNCKVPKNRTFTDFLREVTFSYLKEYDSVSHDSYIRTVTVYLEVLSYFSEGENPCVSTTTSFYLEEITAIEKATGKKAAKFLNEVLFINAHGVPDDTEKRIFKHLKAIRSNLRDAS